MPEWITSAVSNYGYAALFVIALIEGPMATVFGAILASQGMLHLGGVYAVAVAGDLAGDTVLYGLGRGGHRFGRRLEPLLARLRTRPGRVLVTAKLTHAAGAAVLLGAGAARVPFWPFLGFNLLATLPKSGLFVALGFFAGEAWRRIDFWLWAFSCAALAACGVALVVYLRRIGGCMPPGR